MPGACTDTEFRKMWADFEWENKVGVNTTITDMRDYLEHVAKATNMKLLTTGVALGRRATARKRQTARRAPSSDGDCGFLVGNFCAHSIFGEDALTNISIEKADPLDSNSAISGHIRVRAKSQGMALSLGDKVG